MKALRLRLRGDFNSFRMPASMRYQRTYLYPPRTTLLGLAGAALGLGEAELQEVYDRYKVSVVLESYQGLVLDLWSITKIKTTQNERSVVTRELIYRPEYTMYYFSEEYSEQDLSRLSEAFEDPAYPLTLGRSDELVVASKPAIVDMQECGSGLFYRNTVLPFNYRKHEYSFEKAPEKGRLIRLPDVFRLPKTFSLDKGVRKPIGHQEVTHIYDFGVAFKDVAGLTDGEYNVFPL